MNFYAIIGLINAITSLTLGSFVFFKNRKNPVNIGFTLFALSVATWSVPYFLWQISKDAASALFWSRVLMMGAIFIPITYLHFVFALLKILNKRKKFLIFSYLLSFIFFLTNFTPYFVIRVEPLLNFQFWPIAGPVYHLFLILWVFYAYYAVFVLLKFYKKSQGILNLQLKWITIGTIIGYTGGITNYFLWYKIPIPPIGNITASIYLLFVAYTILRYRLMDIRVVLGRTAVYLFSFITVIAFGFLVVFLNNQLTQPLPLNIFGPLIIIFSVFFFQQIFRFFEKLASRYFYYTFYSYQQVLTDLGRNLARILDLDKLSSLIIDTLIKAIKLDRVVVLLREPENGDYQIQRNIGFKEENGISLVKDNFLTIWLEKTQKPLVYEELGLIIRDNQDKEEKQRLENLRENMKRIEAIVCLPLIIKEKIIGLIVLGNKISKEPYSVQDLELLTAFVNQSSIALENARLYDQIQDLSQNLQKKVDEQTKEIRRAYEVEKKSLEVEKKAVVELERLSRAKDQFIMATQHHLRTPLTSMRGYLDLLMDGTYGKVPKRIGEILKKFEISTVNEIRTVNELLDISQFQLGKEVVRLEENVNIETILKEIIEELQFETEKKDIYLKLEEPEQPFPQIKADYQKLKVALFNIVDNGIKYTQQGGVTIKLNIGDHKLIITIQDTGMGIPKEELNTLFARTFERGKTAEKLWGPGKGIGLFLTYHIIKAHQGRIWAESEGPGKGSTFFVELPVG